MTKDKPTGRYFESVDESRFFPGRQFEAQTKIETRKQKFDQLNRFITARGGWVTSVPGESEVRFEVLPDSKLAQQVWQQFPEYEIFPGGPGERILAAGITERFARGANGELVPITQESTKAVAETRLHAGIVQTRRFSFAL